MSLSKYEIFVAVVDFGGVTAAANYLCLTKAAVSKSLSRLEEEAEFDFFERKKRALQLTPAGEKLYLHCKRLMQELDDTRSFVNGLHQAPKGSLRVAVPAYFIEQKIFPYLLEFNQRYPELQLILDNTEKIFDFNDDDVDLIVGFSFLPKDEDVTRKRIDTTRYAICASPVYLQNFGVPKQPEDLFEHRYIGHQARKPINTVQFKDKRHVAIKPILKLTQSREMIQCALNHVGVVQLQEFMVRDVLADGRLVEVLHDFSRDDVSLYIYYKKFRYVQPKVRAFIDFFSEKNNW